MDQVPQQLAVFGRGMRRASSAPLSRISWKENLPCSRGPWLLQLEWTSVTWRTFMVPSVCCSAKINSFRLPRKRRDFITPVAPRGIHRRRGLLHIPRRGAARGEKKCRSSVSATDACNTLDTGASCITIHGGIKLHGPAATTGPLTPQPLRGYCIRLRRVERKFPRRPLSGN